MSIGKKEEVDRKGRGRRKEEGAQTIVGFFLKGDIERREKGVCVSLSLCNEEEEEKKPMGANGNGDVRRVSRIRTNKRKKTVSRSYDQSDKKGRERKL